ncbi:hypothetical protein [Streptomyces sp. MP131-18]|uniref:hypothetical protein n=1 Tax=Streptomyces sp. MP131-18 TaxID=1857892 RepID=UPI00097C7C6F|nr:hypothetical protein [Streptomyces sp. MP131-18]ONK15503.1 hypothetical protein STBA_63220 [Streptomyces sp. MP131-18]
MATFKYFFDPGSGTVLWAVGREAREVWDYAVDHNRLPVSQELRDELSRLVNWFDTSLNWDYPPDPGPWREAECRRFNEAALRAIDRLRTELGQGWQILNEFSELHEDPDLDRYEADPANFDRSNCQ